MKYFGIYLLAAVQMLLAVPVWAQKKDTTRFPIADRRGDAFSIPSRNPFDIRDTLLIKKKN